MSNIYDRFRTSQERKKECYDERSAAFIIEGGVSNEVTHVRTNTTKLVALVFNDKEGPDDVVVFSKIEEVGTDQMIKGDYFIWNNAYFLIYEDVKLTNSELPYKKQRAVECNVIFTVDGQQYNGAFFSTMRRNLSNNLLSKEVIVSNEDPMIIVPSDSNLMIDKHFVIEGKPWKIIDYDHITNRGITYLYIEKYTVLTNEPEPEMQLFAAESVNEVEYIDNTSAVEQQESTGIEKQLSPMTEYTFETQAGFFASTPRVDVLERKATSIRFMIPYGIDSVQIATKNELNQIIEEVYKVVV